jgi:hypothetical protein
LAGALGIAFGLLQLLPTILDKFDPRVPVWIGLFVTAALLTLLADRAQFLLRRRRTQGTLLRHFPLKRIGAADALDLGVFPSRADGPDPPPYVDREVDSAIRAALRARRSVLVFGGARAGKSRTAFEAAKQELGEREVIVPVNGAALASLLEEGAFDGLPDQAVLWLDDLDRFIPILEDPAVQWLLEPDENPLIVATIRTDTYEKILDASGEEGGAGRLILAGIDGFELPDLLTPGEIEGARAKTGRAPPEDIGAAMSIDWKDGYKAARAKGHPPHRGFPTRLWGWIRGVLGWLFFGLWRDVRRDFREDRVDVPLVVAIAAFALAFAATGLIVGIGGFTEDKPPDVERQVDRVRENAVKHGEKVSEVGGKTTLHGGSTSQVVTVRVLPPKPGGSSPKPSDPNAPSPELPPDRLEIYDERGADSGRPAFSFQPAGPYSLKNVKVLDIDADGEKEVVADFVTRGDPPQLRYPVTVAWQSRGKGSYKVSALTPDPPALPRRIKGRGTLFPEPFMQRVTLEDERSGIAIGPVYGVTSDVVVPEAQLLVTGRAIGGFRLRQTILATSVHELEVNDGDVSVVTRCSDFHRGGTVLTRVPPATSFDPVLQRIYLPLAQRLDKVRTEAGCGRSKSSD